MTVTSNLADVWWRRATFALVVAWLFLVARLMVADVWDETNALVAFGNPSWSTTEAVQFVLTQSMGIWRPLPSALAVLMIRAFDDPEIAWRVMRWINAGLLLGSLWLFALAMERWAGRSWRRTALFTLTVLYSASALMVAGWFANLFDAWVLVLLAAGTVLLSRGWHLGAGVLFGVAFFCKETAALSLPMLILFVAAGYLDWRGAIRAGAPAAALGAVYFALRNRVIPFGSSADTHQFLPADFFPTLLGLMESFWRQTLWGDGLSILGFCSFVLSVVAMPSWRARGAYLLLVLASAVVYWQMFSPYQHGVLMHYLIFVGRLYLIPVVITLFVLAMQRQWAVAILAIPIVLGAAFTYVRYEQFQQAYRAIYSEASRVKEKPLTVHFPMKPLSDQRRGLEIGDLPTARFTLDPKTGRLVRRQ